MSTFFHKKKLKNIHFYLTKIIEEKGKDLSEKEIILAFQEISNKRIKVVGYEDKEIKKKTLSLQTIKESRKIIMNNITLQGRLTKDVELNYGKNGTARANFSIAVNRKRTEPNGERKADFFNCTAFGKRAETLANYVKKGHKLLLSGSMEQNTYQNKTYYNVLVNEFDLIEGRYNNNQGQQNFNNGNQQQQQQQQNNDYLNQQQGNQNFNQNQNQQNFNNNQNNGNSDYFGGGFSQVDISDDDLPF